VKQKVTLKIESIAFGGEGIARLDNQVVFVRNVIDGETVEAEITEAKKNFLRAKLIKIPEKSALRINPPCPYFTRCAGCQYQHIDYNHQLEIKRKQVEEILKHIAKIDLSPEPVIPSPKTYDYRRLLEFHSFGGTVGFYTYDNKTLIDVDNCLLGGPAINQSFRKFKKEIKHLPSSFRIILDDSGTAYSTIKDKEQLLSYKVSGKRFSVPVNSFFQTNRALLEKMAETVVNFAKPEKNEILFDCFSGVGFFSIFLSERASRVYGFEEAREASGIASLNASMNGINNFISAQGKAEKNLPELIKEITPDTIILDPPQAGCHPDILKSISQHKIKKIIYISCNPSTLARDIVILNNSGYKLDKVQPIDMFPQTGHIEVISSIVLI
jgi:tRNA/tmRNA/rRNA uracil-C5-methylase (TrmA/RlmC/RlmD family)